MLFRSEGFDDWLDNLYAFVVEVLPLPRLGNAPPVEVALPDLGRPEFAALGAGSREEASKSFMVEGRDETVELTYDAFPRSAKARATEEQMVEVARYLETLKRPAGITDKRLQAFVKFAMRFGRDSAGQLWMKVESGAHRKFLPPDRRPVVLRELHDHIGHRGFFATRAFVCERFWWPDMRGDILWFVRTCHLCQTRQTTKVIIPATVEYPAGPMFRIHADTAFMPGKYKYLAHARCATTSWPEARALTSETGKTLGEFIYQDLLCRWGAVSEIITDNGKPWVAALTYLANKYHIRHIRISGYNSRANGVVESPHHPMRDALYKATEGNGEKWQTKLHSVLWADRASVRRR